MMEKKKDVEEKKKADPVKVASGMFPLRSLFIVSVMCALCKHAFVLGRPEGQVCCRHAFETVFVCDCFSASGIVNTLDD